MLGNTAELTELTEVPDAGGEVKSAFTLYIPLQFWFCRNYGLAIPLVSL